MDVITRKSDIRDPLSETIRRYHSDGINAAIDCLRVKILEKKVKFPLLEFCASELSREIPSHHHIALCDAIEAIGSEGGNVILGKMLQLRLEDHFEETIEKATAYIANATIWYVCDLIGERVYGVALLQSPQATLQVYKKLSTHDVHWVKRGLGAGAHYAAKKGLSPDHIDPLFLILLSMADTREKEIRQGVGWGAKTIARFHPHIIARHRRRIDDTDKVANWFRRKVKIGLDRANYDKGN